MNLTATETKTLQPMIPWDKLCDGALIAQAHQWKIDVNAIEKACMAKGVWIWCVDGAREGFIE